MNDLNLRVRGGIGEKVKKPLAPITMPYWSLRDHDDENEEFFKKFLNSTSADDQLKIMKQYLTHNKDFFGDKMVDFLVLLFWHADAKHPVKGFLKKHITDSMTLREPFTKHLTSVILDNMAEGSPNSHYGHYIDVVTQLDACIDKFPPGVTAVSSLEIQVATYLVGCLESCIETLGNSESKVYSIETKSEPLSPTETNKIYDLVHLTLRLLLYMIQKVTDNNRDKVRSMFKRIRSITAELMSGKDVPMDTKSVSGIVDFTMHLFVNGPDSWIELLEISQGWSGTVALCMHSAVATSVPATALLEARVGDQPAALRLTNSILEIGDQYSSDSSHILAVARTLLAISKTLSLASPTVGSPLVGRLVAFCWSHLEHHMDSVRHLAVQIVVNVVDGCIRMEDEGDSQPLDGVFAALPALDPGGRGYFAALAALAARPRARLLRRRPGLARHVLGALGEQHVQACAANVLETLLKRHMETSSAEEVYQQWIIVILEKVKSESDPTVLSILEKVLAKAVQWNKDILRYILPEERALSSYKGSDLKCVLLILGVVRKSGVPYRNFSQEELRHAAYDADDEVRALGLSLVGESARSTAPLAAAELSFVLLFLEYNVNAQSPNFRQLVLASLKKILKRLEDGFKVLQRNKEENAEAIASYLKFATDLREQCFGSLVAGANYGRRSCALQLLGWQQALRLEGGGGGERIWTKEHAVALHSALDDSYEANKALALAVLRSCPDDVLRQIEGYGSEAYVEQVLQQVSSLKPTDCVSASYKLLLLTRDSEAAGEVPYAARLSLAHRLLRSLRAQAARAQDIARVRDAPMFGLVRALRELLAGLHAGAIAGHAAWSALVRDAVAACVAVNGRVAAVVGAASPEGLLPDHVEQARLAGGRPVTAQMVLLCAWRSVKETSLLLGTLASRLAIEGEAPDWTLSYQQVRHMGETLIDLLATVKHRGAFEQAYVGFTMLLARLWKCKSPRLHQLPLQWYDSVERDFLLPAAGGSSRQYCATRRGAGLPFMIQALVTTELAAESSAPRGRLLQRCLDLCLNATAAFTPADITTDAGNCDRLPNGLTISDSLTGDSETNYEKDSNNAMSDSVSCVKTPTVNASYVSNDSASIEIIGDNEVRVSSLSDVTNDNAVTTKTLTSLGETSDNGSGEAVNLETSTLARDSVVSIKAQDAGNSGSSDATSVETSTRDSVVIVKPTTGGSVSSAGVSSADVSSDSVSSAGVSSDSVSSAGVSSASESEEARAAAAARAHLVLRSLVRHAAPPARAVSAALRAAVRGANAPTWTERNSSTLLFSALTVRIFGVQRGKDSRNLCVRNRMTGRIFFLRYPEMYDFMLEELQSASATGELKPSLQPTLLLLARLYPSALEGTVSNLKLSRFLPHVASLARARDSAARRLAARAAAPLVAHRYIPHIESLFAILGNPKIEMNLCHGILCQLSVLLASPPAPPPPTSAARGVAAAARRTLRLAAGACWPAADEYLAVLNLLLLRFPGCLYTELIAVGDHLDHALFSAAAPKITSGREVYLANAVYMYIIILTLTCREKDIVPLVLRCLAHDVYEVQISALNYLLFLHNRCEDLCSFLEHLNRISDEAFIHKFQNDEKYVTSLCDAFKSSYLECKRKALRVLVCTPRTQNDIVNMKLNSNGELSYEVILRELLDSAESAHESLSSVYLESALALVARSRNVGASVVRAARGARAACVSRGAGARAVVDFFHTQLARMLSIIPEDPADRFEHSASLLAACAALLEHADAELRARAAAAVGRALADMKCPGDEGPVVAARAARRLREWVRGGDSGAALLLVLGCLDFGAGVVHGDELGDECRVFDQNETHNEFLEEFTWTRDCAVKIKEIHRQAQSLLGHTYTAEQFVRSLANDARYKSTIDKLCVENTVDCLSLRAKSPHPKIDMFLEVLRK